MIIIYNNIIKQMEYLSILNSRFHLKYKKKKKCIIYNFYLVNLLILLLNYFARERY